MNRLVCAACWVLIGLGFGPIAMGREVTSSVATEPPIELPKFEVRDSRDLPPPESWKYAEIPGFEILSSVSSRETRRFTEDFLLLQEVIRMIMPVLTRGRSDVPTALVLCGRGNGFEEFMPAEHTDELFSRNSLFFDNPERTAIVIDFALSELQLDNSTTVDADPYRSFYREYFRFLVRRGVGPHSPPWLEEGLVQLFAGIDFNKKWINFGLVGDGFGGSKAGDFNRMLSKRWLMPLDQLFAGDADHNDAFWSAECYAFVHMCLYSAGHRYQKPFLEFVSRLSNEPLSEDLFRQCFHETYKDMAIDLRGYLDFTAHTYLQYKAKKGQQLPDPPPVALRDATQSEVGRIKGEVLRLSGHSDQAHLTLIAPYVRGEKDPRLLAALGLDEEAAGHDDRARKFLEEASREKVVRARAYLELARLRYKAALGPNGDDRKLNDDQLAAVLEPLFTARTQPPPLADVYNLIAEAWSHSATKPTHDQFAVLLEGVRIFPRDPNLLMSAALLATRGGFDDAAHALAKRGEVVFADQLAERDRFALMRTALERDAKPAVESKK